jgi:hypothetical protein
MKLAKVLLAVAAFFLSVSPSVADVTYLYVGNNFNDPYSMNQHITASLTFGSPLAPNSSLGNVTPSSWWITEGTQTASNSNYYAYFPLIFELGTNSSGSIVNWYIQAEPNDGGNSRTMQTSPSWDVTSLPPTGTFHFEVDGNPGTWTTQASPVPEPCSIALALTGVGAVVARRRKKALRSIPQ